jgi:serpin B
LGYSLSSSVDAINFQNQSILTSLEKLPLTPEQETALKPGDLQAPVFNIQNSAWTTNGATDGAPYQFKGSFVKTLQSFYQVPQVTSLDFKNAASADVINAWTKKTTNGMIPSIIDGSTLAKLTWILLNTTYLEGQWQVPFSSVGDGNFTAATGEQVKTKMMNRTAYGRYFSNDQVKAAELEIKNSSMKAYVVLPQNPKDFSTLQQDDSGVWSQSFWQKTVAGLQSMQGMLRMPQFNFGSGVTLQENDPLTLSMGLNFLFQNNTDLSNMDDASGRPSKVGIIKQNTNIEWGPNGIKAAAATLVGGMTRSAIMIPNFQMIVDRPFYFAVYDQQTDAFLFLGQVVGL